MKKLYRFSTLLVLTLSAYLASANNNPEGYELVAYEGETKTFQRPVDLAYGANGRYHYLENFTGTIRFDNRSFGGDPIDGVSKAGYVKTRYGSGNQNNNQNMDDFEFVANENETKTFNQPTDLAYGANGRYHYIENYTGTIRFDNRTFGGDPIEGVTKSGYFKPRQTAQQNYQNMDDYEFVAKENETRTFQKPVDLAYGADGRYHYIENYTGTIRFDNRTFGGDPIDGVAKSGYVKRSHNSYNDNRDMNDYKLVASENESKTFRRPVDLAYGTQDRFHYIENFTGTIRFDNDAFGGDPYPGKVKQGYVRKINQRNPRFNSKDEVRDLNKNN